MRERKGGRKVREREVGGKEGGRREEGGGKEGGKEEREGVKQEVPCIEREHKLENKGDSDTLTLLFSWSIMTLCGFTSLCMTPMLWQ